ncbi:MAG: chemotaxis protein CheW [Candidatus Kariarchaeaceae archaeon]
MRKNTNVMVLDGDYRYFILSNQMKSEVNDIGSAAHTIKGMAATMSYNRLTKLTHEIESHLLSTKVVSSGLIQTLFKCADRLQLFYDTVSTDKDPEKIDVDGLISELKAGGARTEPVRTAPVATSTVEEEDLRLGVSYKINISFDPNTRLLGARGYQAFRVVDAIAQITSSDPTTDVLEEGRLVGDIEMEIISYESELEIREALSSIGDVSEIVITNLMEETTPTITGPSFRRVVQSVRVNLDRLDQVIDLLGELVITRGRFQTLVKSITPEISEQFQIFDNTITTIQDTVMGFRMVNLSHIFDTYPRAVRDIASSRGMKMDLLLQGTSIQIDRSVVDQVNEALLHLVRNACTHGIEDERIRSKLGKPKNGSIRLAARRERGEVVFEIEDDGSGLDIDAIKAKGVSLGLITEDTRLTRSRLASLIFRPGFTTAKEVTEVAGRGVGMEIVKNTIDEINGTIEIRTKKDVGTKFILRVPQTLAIIEGLIVLIGAHEFVIPLLNVEKILSIRDPSIEEHEGKKILNWQNHNIRIIDMKEKLGEYLEHITKTNGDTKKPAENNQGRTSRRRRKSQEKVILWERAGNRIGLLVNNVLEQKEIVTKQLDAVYQKLPGFSGATILGYDQVALIIDPDNIEELN